MATEKMDAIVGAKISQFKRKMAEVKARAKSVPNNIVIGVKVRAKKSFATIDKIGTSLRNIGEIGQNMIGGVLTASFTGIIPVVASAGAAIGALGPIMGVVGGAALGMGAAFGAAGAGAVGFAAVATSALNDVFGANKNILKYQKQLAQTSDEKKRAKIKDKIAKATANLSDTQKEGLKSLQSFEGFWSKFAKQFQKPVMKDFTAGLKDLQSILKAAEPAIQGATKAVGKLMDYLGKQLKTKDTKAFFKWLGQSAGPAIETFGKAFINVMQGVMNLMVGFDPLSKNMESGILSMSKSFEKWTSKVKKSKGLQNFIKYVETNGPKLLKIIGNIGGLLIGAFSAFAPTASDMLDGLVKLTGQFKKWGQTLSKNKQFQAFIKYVKTNGPKILSLIGSIAKLVIDLATAMAPLGAKVLTVATAIAKWLDKMIKAHPWVGKMIGILIAMIGVLKLVGPPILLIDSLFGGLVKKMLAGFAKMAAKAVAWAAKMAIQWMVAMGPLGIIIAAVIALVVLIIANWKTIWKWTKKIFNAVWGFMKKVWAGIKSVFSTVMKAIWSAIKWYFNTYKKVITTIFNAIWGFIKKVWHGIESVFSGAWSNILKGVRGFKRGFLGVWDGIKNGIRAVINPIIGFLNSMLNGIERMINGIASAINSIPSFSVPDWVPLIGGGSFGLPHIPHISVPNIPSLATGGVTDQPTLAVIGDAGTGNPEVTAPEKMLKSIFSGVLAKHGKETGQKIINNFRGMMEGATFVVREDADIDRIAEELGERFATAVRG